jgi:hypothetical protein
MHALLVESPRVRLRAMGTPPTWAVRTWEGG